MATANVKLGSIGSHWTTACKQAVTKQAGAIAMPPPQLSDDSIDMLKGLWS